MSRAVESDTNGLIPNDVGINDNGFFPVFERWLLSSVAKEVEQLGIPKFSVTFSLDNHPFRYSWLPFEPILPLYILFENWMNTIYSKEQ